MAIAAIFEIPDFTQQQYDKVVSDLAAAGLGTPEGHIHHLAAAMETGMFIVDMWESEELLGKCAESLIPLIVATGATPAEPRIFPVHNTIT
jgi:hypothetical protein